MVVHAYNPSTHEAEEECHEFEASLGYIVRPCLKGKKKKNPSRLYNCTSSSCLSNMAFTGDGWVAEVSNCCRRIIGGCGPSGDMSPRSGDTGAPSSEFKNKICTFYFQQQTPLYYYFCLR
jgi:hypothetical protein